MEGPLTAGDEDPTVRSLPLRALRVVETTDESASLAGRLLADLGADVILVEPPGGSPARAAHPVLDGVSLSFAVRNANKRSVVLDTATPAGQQRMLELLSDADVWIDSAGPGVRDGTPLDVRTLRERLPGLVVVSVTPFGHTGPYRDHAATSPVLFALSGLLSLSRLPDRPPLLPPGRMACDMGAVMAAYAALVAVWHRLSTGRGGYVELSIHEAMAQADDAVLPVAEVVSRAGIRTYPVYRCTDGFVRLVLLTPRHSDAMSAWLDEEQDAGAADDATEPGREAEALEARYQRFFGPRPVAAVVEEAQGRGIPLAPIIRPGDVLAMEPLRTGGVFVDHEVRPGIHGQVPAGFFELDDHRAGIRERAPLAGADTDQVAAALDRRASPFLDEPLVADGSATSGSPLTGLRVLDFGVVYAAPETGKLLADFGADVIRVESRTYPDLARLAGGSSGMTAQFVTLNRNKRSVGVNLKTDDGLRLVQQLVRMADVLVENMAPGTLEKLGLGVERLRELNPRLVVVSSQLFGNAGALTVWRGFGPSARGVGGLTALWRYPDDEMAFAETSTVFPDHFVGRLGALAALAALIERRSSRRGQWIKVPQAGAVINYLSDLFLLESLAPGAAQPAGNRSSEGAPWGVYPCAGDDQWCVVTVRDDDDWKRLRVAIGSPGWADDPRFETARGRRADADELDHRLAGWTSTYDAAAVMDQLQRAGVPAAVVHRPVDLLGDPQLEHHGFARMLIQPGWDPLFVEGDCFRSDVVSPAPLEPAPQHGQHTREVCAELLGLSDEEVAQLIVEGVLEVPDEA
jgi:crotonobetainyl-CoA:carnitine CoA-transferase CaiB-like acyl-CoA transferase